MPTSFGKDSVDVLGPVLDGKCLLEVFCDFIKPFKLMNEKGWLLNRKQLKKELMDFYWKTKR